MKNSNTNLYWPPHEPVFLFILLILGIAANYLSFPLFFGVDFLFGSIFSLVVLSIYGLAWGAVSAIVVSSYTYFLWGHPYAIVIFSLEIIFIGFCLIKSRFSMLQCAGLFWAFLGIPAVFIFYHLIMQMDIISTLVVMLKQCANGIFNALIATLLINMLPALRNRCTVRRSKTIPMREILFNFMVVLVFLSVLVVMIIEGRTAKHRLEQAVATNLQTLSTDVSGHLELWFKQHMHAVTELATLVANTYPEASQRIQDHTEIVSRMFPDFHNMYVADAFATTIAFFPPVNEKGESTIGLNFSDRDYFKKLKTTRRPVLSKVFMGRGGVFSPIVTMSAPVIIEDQFKGYSLAALNLAHLGKIVQLYSQKNSYGITLTDAEDRVIASSLSERTPMHQFSPRQQGELQRYNDAFFLWSPSTRDLPTMTRFSRSFYLYENFISKDLPWKITIQCPVSRQQQLLFSQYIRYLSTLLICTVVAFILASLISSWMARPLAQLAQWTKKIPDPQLLSSPKNSVFPKNSITEIDLLVNNFEAMSLLLKSNFVELENKSRETEQVNISLKDKIDELEAARQALKESEERFRNSFDNAPIGMALVDTDDHFVQVNRALCNILGYTQDELLSKSIPEITHPKDRELETGHKTQISDGSADGFQMIKRYVRSDGNIVWGKLNVSTIYDIQKNPLYYVGQLEDITAQKDLEAQLLQSQKMEAIGTLAGGVAHDFNNLLQAIQGYAELLISFKNENDSDYKDLRKIYAAATRGGELTRQLLAFSRKLKSNKRSVDLNYEIKTARDLMDRTIPKMIEIDLQLEENLKKNQR